MNVYSDFASPMALGFKWSQPDNFKPEIGERVLVTLNSLGTGVVKYICERQGYIAIMVDLDDPPDWYVKQNKNSPAIVYGAEVKQYKEKKGMKYRVFKRTAKSFPQFGSARKYTICTVSTVDEAIRCCKNNNQSRSKRQISLGTKYEFESK